MQIHLHRQNLNKSAIINNEENIEKEQVLIIPGTESTARTLSFAQWGSLFLLNII